MFFYTSQAYHHDDCVLPFRLLLWSRAFFCFALFSHLGVAYLDGLVEHSAGLGVRLAIGRGAGHWREEFRV